MESNCKAVISKTSFPLDGCLNYDVQLWYEWHAGAGDYVYAGYGKYFRDPASAKEYAAEHSTVPVEYQH